jgi:prevent-host-death family protein
MKEVAISEFKAKCLGMLEQVRKTRKPIRITRFGVPVAEIVPLLLRSAQQTGLGVCPARHGLLETSLVQLAAKTIGKRRADESAAGYPHMDLERPRTPKNLGPSHETTDQSRESALALVD